MSNNVSKKKGKERAKNRNRGENTTKIHHERVQQQPVRLFSLLRVGIGMVLCCVSARMCVGKFVKKKENQP